MRKYTQKELARLLCTAHVAVGNTPPREIRRIADGATDGDGNLADALNTQLSYFDMREVFGDLLDDEFIETADELQKKIDLADLLQWHFQNRMQREHPRNEDKKKKPARVEPTRVGFWYSEREPHLPKPKPRLAKWSKQGDFIQLLTEMEVRAKEQAYKGFSRCRCCGAMNGSTEYTYKGWTWPQGLLHYVREHNVKPDNLEFIQFVLTQD